jgi:hypothetical protein
VWGVPEGGGRVAVMFQGPGPANDQFNGMLARITAAVRECVHAWRYVTDTPEARRRLVVELSACRAVLTIIAAHESHEAALARMVLKRYPPPPAC